MTESKWMSVTKHKRPQRGDESSNLRRGKCWRSSEMIDMVEKTAFLKQPLTEKLGLLVLNWSVFILEVVTFLWLIICFMTGNKLPCPYLIWQVSQCWRRIRLWVIGWEKKKKLLEKQFKFYMTIPIQGCFVIWKCRSQNKHKNTWRSHFIPKMKGGKIIKMYSAKKKKRF